MDIGKLLYEVGLVRAEALDAKDFNTAKLLDGILELIEAQESIIYFLETEKYDLQSENTRLKSELDRRK